MLQNNSVIFEIIKLMKIKERQNKTKKTWQLNAMHDLGLFFFFLGHYWNNWQKLNDGCRIDGINVPVLIS